MSSIKDKFSNIPITVKVSSAYALCSILQRCMSFITMPIFARLLSKEQFGHVTIYNSWQGIIAIFITLNLAYGSFSTAMIKYEKDRDGYISSVEGLCLLLTSLFLFIYLPFRNIFNSLFELPTFFVCVMAFEIMCTTALLMWSGKKRFEFKYKTVVIVTLLISLISPIVQLICVKFYEEKGFAKIFGTAIVNCLFGLFFFFLNIFRGKKLFDKTHWKFAIGFNVPLLAYYLSQIVFNQSDRIMISHLIGTDKAAEYGVAYSIAMVLTFVLNAINNSYVPWYYSKLKTGNINENRVVSLAIAIIMALLLLAVIWFAPEIIVIMAGDKYKEAVFVVPPVSISLLLLFYSQLFINVEFYYEEKKKLIGASIGAALVNVVLNLIFIKLFGYIAAAYTTLISYIIFAIANNIAMKKVLSRNNVKDTGFDYKWLVLLFFILCFLALIGVLLYKMLILRIIVCATVLIVLILKRNIFIGLYNKIKVV